MFLRCVLTVFSKLPHCPNRALRPVRQDRFRHPHLHRQQCAAAYSNRNCAQQMRGTHLPPPETLRACTVPEQRIHIRLRAVQRGNGAVSVWLRCSFTPKIQKQQFRFSFSADKPRNNLGIVKAAFDRLILKLRLYVFSSSSVSAGSSRRAHSTSTLISPVFAAHGRLY